MLSKSNVKSNAALTLSKVQLFAEKDRFVETSASKKRINVYNVGGALPSLNFVLANECLKKMGKNKSKRLAFEHVLLPVLFFG